jgi:hypothetical protein
MADQLPKTSAFHRFTDKESQLLAHLRGQYEALGAAETAAPPSNNMDF